MTLIDVIERAGSAVEAEIPAVNRGGCAVYAATLARELHIRGIVVYGIVAALGADQINLFHARKMINDPSDVGEWADQGVTFGHVAVLATIDGQQYTIDSSQIKRGRTTPSDYSGRVYPGELDLEELEALASTGRGWNWEFDRSNIQRLRRLVRAEFAAAFPIR